MITQNDKLAEQREKKERSCYIIINGREENREQSYDVLIVNNMTQQERKNVAPKLKAHSKV